ncbi:hypothetical protein [Actinomadura gamaensis]|uniref:Phenylacetate-coenzyme A ligase n=1 Tax=Actinomadura gamaensis TaxID=1763541 RepID=A0ABV9TXN6_9ACTN
MTVRPPAGRRTGLMPDADLPRLREELTLAYERTRLARAKFDAAGRRPADVRDPADLALVPLTTRAEYRQAFPAGVLVDGATLNDPMVVRSRSSGTAHERLLSADYAFTLAERRFGALDVHPELMALLADPETRRSVRYAAPNCSDVECSLPQVTMADRILPNGMLVLPSAHDLYTTPETMLRKAWDEIAEWEPDYLSCDPTRFAHLTRAAEERGWKPDGAGLPGRALVMTYNFAPAFATAHLRSRLPAGMLVASSVTMSEFGWVAASCPDGTLHLNTAAFWMELLDGDGRPVGPGEIGELIVTTLGDPLSPRVRYRTGDLYRWLDGCPCGHPHPAVRFEGRDRDAVRCQDGTRLTTRGLDDLVGAPEHLIAYKFHQHAPDRAEFRYVSDRGALPGWERELTEALAGRLGAGCRVDVAAAPVLPSERSGKFLTCTTSLT